MLAAALAESNRFAITSRDADLIVVGVVTEFAPAGPAPGQAAQVAIEMGLLDGKTSQVFASGTARGRAADTAGLGPSLQPALGAGLAAHAGTPLEKAIRAAVQSATQLVVNGTPAAYYRHTETAARPPAPTGPRLAAPATAPPPPAPARSRAVPAGHAPGAHAGARAGIRRRDATRARPRDRDALCESPDREPAGRFRHHGQDPRGDPPRH